MLKSRLSIFHQYCSNGYLFFFFFLKNGCVLSLVEKKIILWFKEAPKSLNFFLSKCKKNKIKLKLRAWRQEKGTVNGEYNVRQF